MHTKTSAGHTRASTLRFAVWWITLGLLTVGLLLRIGPKDRWRGFDAIYYATPWPVLAALAGILAFLLWRRGQRKCSAGMLAIVIALCGVHVATSWYCSPVSLASPSELYAEVTRRIVCWNTGRGKVGLASIPSVLSSFDADVICLVESKHVALVRAALQAELPEHQQLLLPSGFTVLSRCGLPTATTIDLPRGKAVRIAIPHSAGTLHLVLVDVPSNPLGARGPAILALANEALRTDAAPTLLLGDFNTPRSSVHFTGIRQHMVHAFETAGDGWVETWPAWLPLLDLDHVWCNSRIEPVRCEHRAAWNSDHRAVVLDFRMR